MPYGRLGVSHGRFTPGGMLASDTDITRVARTARPRENYEWRLGLVAVAGQVRMVFGLVCAGSCSHVRDFGLLGYVRHSKS